MIWAIGFTINLRVDIRHRIDLINQAVTIARGDFELIFGKACHFIMLWCSCSPSVLAVWCIVVYCRYSMLSILGVLLSWRPYKQVPNININIHWIRALRFVSSVLNSRGVTTSKLDAFQCLQSSSMILTGTLKTLLQFRATVNYCLSAIHWTWVHVFRVILVGILKSTHGICSLVNIGSLRH